MFECRQFPSIFHAPFGTENTWNTQFSALLHALTYWAGILHMTLFYCTTIQVWVPSICVNYVGVMPILELRIPQIHSFPHFSLTCFDILSWNFAYKFVLLYFRSSLRVVNLRKFLWELCPFWNLQYENTQFSAFFSYMLWHIELKFCTWLCSTVLQFKIECRRFASIIVGVMPLLELIILRIHNFPHFSFTCFDILSWNFAYDFVLLYFRSSLRVVNLRKFLWELCSFWNLQYENTQFSAFFSYMLWHIELKFCTWLCSTVLQFKIECRRFESIIVGVLPLLELRILRIHNFPHFSFTCFDILSWNFAYDFVLLDYRSRLSIANFR